MGDTKDARSRAMENLSLEFDKYPRLLRFTCSNTQQSKYGKKANIVDCGLWILIIINIF